ncbi:MAG: D-aminoacyl-tRNA deacylase [Bacteroidales bacterium]
MRVLIQRVLEAKVKVEEKIHSEISKGLLVFVGIEKIDTIEDAIWLARKVVNLRIFDDENGVMNYSIKEIDGDILVVSQFTLHALTKKGNRPSYIRAASPEIAIPLYEHFIKELTLEFGKQIKTGIFGANMKIALINDGPVTIWIDSKNKE